MSSAPNELEPNTVITAALGASVSALEVLSAEKLRAWAFDYIHELFDEQNLTFIATPTVPILAPVLSEAAWSVGESNVPLVMSLLRYIFLANFLGLPGHSCPIGHVRVPQTVAHNNVGDELLPVGFHLLGNHWTENKLLRIAHALDEGFQESYERPLYYVDILSSS
jgi:Asp-tRNA(Asn)/Glu-tRNA(Gln) amidotransferase A subunit family amidase